MNFRLKYFGFLRFYIFFWGSCCKSTVFLGYFISFYLCLLFRVVLVPFFLLKLLRIYFHMTFHSLGFLIILGSMTQIHCVFGIFLIFLLVSSFSCRIVPVPFFIFEYLRIFALSPLGLSGFTYYFGGESLNLLCFRGISYLTTCVFFFVLFLCHSSYWNWSEISPSTLRFSQFSHIILGSMTQIHCVFGIFHAILLVSSFWWCSYAILLIEIGPKFHLQPFASPSFHILFWGQWRNYNVFSGYFISFYLCLLFRVVLVPFFIFEYLRIFALSPLGLSGFTYYFGGESLNLLCFRGNSYLTTCVFFFVLFFLLKLLWIFIFNPSLLLGFTYYFGDSDTTSLCFRDISYHSTFVFFFLPYCAFAFLYFEISLNFHLQPFASLRFHILFWGQ